MYREFFGLRESPFDLTPNPRFLFLSPRHREALGNLQYGAGARKGVTVLVGQAGTGKTTIIRAFLASAAAAGDARFVYFDNPALTRDEFYELLAKRLGFSEAAAASKAEFLLELETMVTATGLARRRLVLILDEAQSLPVELLEEARLLTNMETESEKQVSLVLAGQPELADRLEEPRFEALKQRVALRCELAPFNLGETAAYIGGRLRIAGGDPGRIFTQDAVVAIHEASHGIARTISIICDNALLGGFGADVRPVGLDIVAEVCSDFRLGIVTPKAGAPLPGVAMAGAPNAGVGLPGGSKPSVTLHGAAKPGAPKPGAAKPSVTLRGAANPGATATPGAARPGAPLRETWQEPDPILFPPAPEPPAPEPVRPPAAARARGGFFSRFLPRRNQMITLRQDQE